MSRYQGGHHHRGSLKAADAFNFDKVPNGRILTLNNALICTGTYQPKADKRPWEALCGLLPMLF